MLVLLHSPKGGVGSTFLTAQLAMHLAGRGHQVTAIDLTFQDSLKLHFGILPSQPITSLSYDAGDTMVVHGVELLSGHAITEDPRFLDMLAGDDPALFDPAHVTLLDVSSGQRGLKARLLKHCDLHICALLPFPASLAALPKVEPGTVTTELTKTGFVLNQLDDTRRLSRHSHTFIRELLGDLLLGTVRRDEAVNEAIAMFQPLAKVAPSSVAALDLARLATTIEARLGLAAAEVAPAAKLPA
ncbi:MAG: cellulose synthase operon protein YhjQ/BcsQ [Novosphingobium sp.]